MSEFKPFLSNEAVEIFPDNTEGDFILPACKPEVDLMLGAEMAILVLTTVEDQRVGIPLELDSLSALYAVLGEALLRMQAPEGGTVQ